MSRTAYPLAAARVSWSARTLLNNLQVDHQPRQRQLLQRNHHPAVTDSKITE
jgi:hypothetical protein